MCLVEATRCNYGDGEAGYCWMDCCGICLRLAHWECFPSVESGVWLARAGT